MTKAPSIMIVEDDDFVAQAVKLELEYLGYAVPVIAGSGEEAVAQAQRHQPDLVLMDIVLPGKMDGIAAAHQISGFSIPVVYLSGHMDEQLLERAKITEPFGYLLKPYSPQQLHATIAMALYKWRAEIRLRESAWMSAAFLCVSDAIFILDAGERIVLMNPAAQQLTKIDQAAAIGRSWRDVFKITGELSSETLGMLIVQALHRGEDAWREAGASLVLDGGVTVPVSLSINPLWREEAIHGVSLVVRDISRKLALAYERRQLASLVENSDDFIGVAATDGGTLYLNPAGRRLVGAGSLEAVKGRNILDFFSPVGRAVVQDHVFPALLRQGKWRGELNYRHLDNGGDIPVELNMFLIKETETGQGLTFGSIARDITQRKQDERALAESNARFSAIFNSITDSVIFVDIQRRILLINPAFTALFGYEGSELIGRTTKRLYADSTEYHEQGQVRFNTGVRPRKSLYEMRYRRKDGSVFIGETVGLPARDVDDNVVGFVAVVRDITERVEMARSLQQERAFLKAVLDHIEDGVVACNAAGVLTLFNRAITNIHGLPATPIPAAQWAEHYNIYQEDGKTLMKMEALPLYRALQGEPVQNEELTIIPKQGLPRLVVASGRAFFDDAGNKLGAVVSVHDITERRRAEEALRQSENRFRALMQQAGDALIVCDLQGRILDANQAACDLSGYRRDELAERAVTDLIQGSAREEVVASLARLAVGRPVTIESEHRRRDATVFPVEVRVGLIDMPGQRVAMALIRDISARKKAEQALHKANRAYQALSDCDMAIAKATAERALLQKVCRILVERCGYRFVWIGFPQHDRKKGIKPVAHAGFEAGFLDGLDVRWSDTAKGRGPLGAAIRKGRVAVVRSIRRSAKFAPWRKQAMKRGYASVAALPLIHGKETLGVLAIYAEIADAFDADELQLLRGLAHDIAYGIATLRTREEHRRAEQSLRDSEEKHRLLFETMSQGVVYQDARGRILSANPSAEAILGFHLGKMRKSAPATPSWRAIHEDGSDFPAETHPAMDALATGRVVTDIVMGVIHPPARSNRWILVSATPQWRPGEKKPYQVYSTFTDITERRQVAAELQEYRERLEDLVAERTRELTAVNKELEAFSYSVSHDLRAPLRSINGFSLALLEDYGGKFDEQAQDYLSRVSDGARRMGELIDDMLTLSRITRREMRLEPLDLSAIAEDITAGLVHSGTGRDVEIAIMPNLSAIGDRGLMRIVLENLLGNAWKFTGKRRDARLEFGAARIDGQHTFYVRDNGAGFEMAYADKLFGAFQRLHAYTEFEGTGVGLATVQRAIHRHGGEVWGEGAVDEGATFYFRLPA